MENAFEKEDLNLNEGDSLFIIFDCVFTEKKFSIPEKKNFYLSYLAYFLNSNNQIEKKLISDQSYSLKNEIELSLKNEAYQIYKYKKVSNIINNGTMTKNFSTVAECGNLGFFPVKNASKIPGFCIQIEDTKELRKVEVVPDHSFGGLFFKILGSVSFIINIIVVFCCLAKNRCCIKRVHSSEIDNSKRDNLQKNELNINENAFIDELNNQNE